MKKSKVNFLAFVLCCALGVCYKFNYWIAFCIILFALFILLYSIPYDESARSDRFLNVIKTVTKFRELRITASEVDLSKEDTSFQVVSKYLKNVPFCRIFDILRQVKIESYYRYGNEEECLLCYLGDKVVRDLLDVFGHESFVSYCKDNTLLILGKSYINLNPLLCDLNKNNPHKILCLYDFKKELFYLSVVKTTEILRIMELSNFENRVY